MFVIGIDAHKSSHTLVAVDGTGRRQAEKTVDATDSGHHKALRWARGRYPTDELTWAIEDVRHVSGRLERFLLESGERCVRVPTRLMARTRHETSRVPGKSDPVDALAVARAYLREPSLPVACHDDASRELKLLVDYRESLVMQRTAIWNRLLWRIHELDPGRKVGPLDAVRHREPVQRWLATLSGVVAQLAGVELEDIARLTTDIRQWERRIDERVRDIAPNLLDMPGVGTLTAARIIGEAAMVTRFAGSEAAFARFAGVAPAPRWSGSTAGQMRRSKVGNRRLNSAVHRVAVTQLRLGGPGRLYFEKKVQEGHSRSMALRSLKRRVCRVVFTRLNADHRIRYPNSGPPETWAGQRNSSASASDGHEGSAD